jgi:protein SCO1/2
MARKDKVCSQLNTKRSPISLKVRATGGGVVLVHRPRTLGLGLIILVAGVGTSCSEQSAEPRPAHEHAAHQVEQASPDPHAAHAGGHASPDPHAAHRAALEKPQYSVITERYSVPDVNLLDQSGASVALRTLLESDKPVALNFIFTTCTTICPVMTATFTQMQRDLGEAAGQIRLVSISVDPEYDRPGVLGEYAKRFGARGDWTFLTGDEADILRVLVSFKAHTGSKMNHRPLTLLKSPQSPSWTRIDGLASGEDLAREVTARLLN